MEEIHLDPVRQMPVQYLEGVLRTRHRIADDRGATSTADS